MNDDERELLLLLAETVSEELTDYLKLKGLRPGEGVGGRRLIRIGQLATMIAAKGGSATGT
jgi:hypothetical protein